MEVKVPMKSKTLLLGSTKSKYPYMGNITKTTD
jgi:hypothetical protein